MDAVYDFEAIYGLMHRMGHRSIIAYNKRNEPEPISFDDHFARTSFCEHLSESLQSQNYYRSAEICGTSPRLKARKKLFNRWTTAERAKLHFNLLVLLYNASQLAADRNEARLQQLRAAWFLFFEIPYANSALACILKRAIIKSTQILDISAERIKTI